MSDQTQPPAIYGQMLEVMKTLGSFEKKGVGPSTQNSYPFLRVDDIVARLTPALIEHGVATESHISEVDQDRTRFPKVTPNGDVVQDGRATLVQTLTRLRYDIAFISVIDGSRMTSNSYGESQDTGDKGIRRAATAAFKEILLRTLSIVSGEDDPDAFDPNDQPPAVAYQDRGAQQREKAAQPKVSRSTRTKPEPKVDEATPAPAAPAAPAAAIKPPEPGEEPTPEAPTAPIEKPQRATPPAAEKPAEPVAAPAPVREEQSPAEQRAADWTPDPADIAHAEEQAAQREVVPLPEKAPTKAEERQEDVGELRAAIREAYEARGMERMEVNRLGDYVAKKPRAKWFSNIPDLRKVLKAIENGEVAPDDEQQF